MSFFGSASARPDRSTEGYEEFDEQSAATSRSSANPGRGFGEDDDTSGDLELAMALSRESGGLASGGASNTDRDEELALALAMAMDEENDGNEEVPPPPPPRPARSQVPPEIAPRKQSIDPAGIAQSMFDRIMSTFRGRSSSSDNKEERRARVQRYKEKIMRQSTQVYNVMEVIVPDFTRTNTFLVLKPDGTVSMIVVPDMWQHPPFYLTFDGEPLMKGPPRILDENEQMSAFLDYYRFDPIEIEAQLEIIPGPRPLGGLELVSQPEGVFVRWGVLPLPKSEPRSLFNDNLYAEGSDDEEDDEMGETEVLETQNLVKAGDLIVQVGSAPTTSLESLRSLLSSFPVGSRVEVRVLRKPPPTVRCPMGHTLKLDDPRASLEAECDSCRANFGRHHCVECGFSLCWPCFQIIYNHSKARSPVPVNNDHDFTEAPRTTRVTFTPADVGLKVLIYWYTTAEWWIGQVESFDPAKGHVMVYEERNGTMCRETIPDFSKREYRILTHCVLNSEAVESFHAATLGEQKKASGSETATAPLPMDLLNDDTPYVVEGSQPDLLELKPSSALEPLPADIFSAASTNSSFSTAAMSGAPLLSSVSMPTAGDETERSKGSTMGLSGSFLEPMKIMATNEDARRSTDQAFDMKSLVSSVGVDTPSGVGETSGGEDQAVDDDDKVVVSAEEADLLKSILEDSGPDADSALGETGNDDGGPP